MYRKYTAQQGAEILPLARWYRWYRVEKLSEGHGLRQAPAAGCSVDATADSGASGMPVSEGDFLALLRARQQENNP